MTRSNATTHTTGALWTRLVSQLLLMVLLVVVEANVVEQQQQQQECANPDTSRVLTETQIPDTSATQTSVSYVRDSPLHMELVNDTWRSLEKFSDDSTGYRPRYFEGWYYKIDLPGDDGGTFVVIPGLYLRKEEQHGFVMVLDATKEGNHEPKCYFYDDFPIRNVTGRVDGDHDFVFQLDENNIFTAHGYKLDLPASAENPAVVGSAEWGPPLPLPATRINPTIMGWFSWLPRGFMQCSHGVVSMDHTITNGQVQLTTATGGEEGETTTTTKEIILTGSQGYIEKDWGREFPQKYTWIQASDFYHTSTNNNNSTTDDTSSTKKLPGASFLVSVASIPVKPFEDWLQFTGFLSFLRFPDPDHGNDGGNTFRTIRMATYTGAKASYNYDITDSKNGPREHKVVVNLLSSQYNLTATVRGDRDNAATLWGPLPSNPSGGMRPYVREMLNCPLEVVLRDRKNNNRVVFEGLALHGGFEIEGHDGDDPTTENGQPTTIKSS